MKTVYAMGLSLVCAALCLGGCGGGKSAEDAQAKKSLLARVVSPVTDAAKSVADVVSKPFEDKKDGEKDIPAATGDSRLADINSRTCSDNYETVRPGLRRRDAWAEPKDEYRLDTGNVQPPQVKAPMPRPAAPATPFPANDAETASALEQEYKRIAEREELEAGRLKEYRDKKRELEEIIREYENRYSLTQERKKKIEILMSALENDPQTLDRAVRRELSAAAGQQMEEDFRACAAPNADGWTPSRGVQAGRPSEVFQPEIGADYSRQNDIALLPPPGEAEGGRSAAAQPRAMASAIATTVLAVEGSGADAAVIIGAGTLQGVRQGMLFATTAAPRAVLVVTEVYPTYARAQIHPQYANGALRVRDQIAQISDLPRNDK